MRKTLPTVSIVVPVYNVAPYITECIKSIQNQTFRNIEIILVDDGSTDGSSELCDSFAENDSRIKVIHQENAGVVKARQAGVNGALGEYLSFVDGDDWVESGAMEAMLALMGSADMVTTGVFEETSPNVVMEKYDEFPEGIYRGEQQISGILKSMIYDFDTECLHPLTPWGVNKLFRTELAREVYQSLDCRITFAEDTVFLCKYLLRCQAVVIKHQCFYHYRYRDGSARHAVNDHMLMNINRVYLALEKDFRRHPLREKLLLQLQKWMLLMDYWAVNDYMGFDKRIYLPQFVADISGLENKKLIVYGAGRVGTMAYAQLHKFGYRVVLWADRNYESYQDMGMPVVSPAEILNAEYDLIFLAVSERDAAEKIKEELTAQGVPGSKFVWKAPMRIF